MVRYELKKIFGARRSWIALLILLIIMAVFTNMALDVGFTDEQGITSSGVAAAHRQRDAKKQWAGVLDEEKIRAAIKENLRIEQTPEARSESDQQQNTAYSWKIGFSDIRDLINHAFSDSFRSYDYYTADRLQPEDAARFYDMRILQLKNWLTDEKDVAINLYTQEERDFLIQRYEALNTPMLYDYKEGWEQLMEFLPGIIMFVTIILGYLVAGIFSNEFKWHSDAIFFSSYRGRNSAVSAKLKAGVLLVSVVYWLAILLFSGVMLLLLGADGASCPIQILDSGWKSIYNVSILQAWLIAMLTGYLGCLFMSLVAMVISVETRSAVVAVMTPFLLILMSSFINAPSGRFWHKLVGLLPYNMVNVDKMFAQFNLYSLFGVVLGGVPTMLLLYGSLSLFALLLIYGRYRHKEVR